MSRTWTYIGILAFTLPLFTSACDEEAEFMDDDDKELGEVDSRTCLPDCFGSGNTNFAGAAVWNNAVENSLGTGIRQSDGTYTRIDSITCPYGGSTASMLYHYATSKGEWVFQHSVEVSDTVRGTAVAGCRFNITMASNSTFSSNVVTGHITVYNASSFTRADGATTGYKYTATTDLNNGHALATNGEYHTCGDNADASGNYTMTIIPGYTLDTANWAVTAGSNREIWACAAGAFGHAFINSGTYPNADVGDFTSAALLQAVGQAYGLVVGTSGGAKSLTNPGYTTKLINKSGSTIEGFATTTGCNEYYEGMWNGTSSGAFCRGLNSGSAYNQMMRLASPLHLDWDDVDASYRPSVCTGTTGALFVTVTPCYWNGSSVVCPENC